MPTSPLVPRALVVAVVALLAMLGPVPTGPVAGSLSAASAAPTPLAPPDPAQDAPVALDLVEMGPASLAPGGTLSVEVEITNTSDEVLEDPSLALRTRGARVTDRADLSAWQSVTDPDTTGEPRAEARSAAPLAPGDSRVLRVSVLADELGFSAEPYFWGTRRVSLTVSSDGTPLASLRTFVVWRPPGAEGEITRSVLLPVAGTDPGAAVADPEAFAASVDTGHLAGTTALARRADVDWWLDPALLDVPRLPEAGATDGAEGEATDGATPTAEEPTGPTPDGSAASDDGGTPGGDRPTPAVTPVLTYAADPTAAAVAGTLAEAAEDRTVLTMPYARADLVGLDTTDRTVLTDALAEASDRALEGAGIVPSGGLLAVPGPEADAAALAAASATGTDTLLVPASSLRSDPAGSVTPSSVALLTPREGAAPVRVLAPDPVLGAELSLLDGSSDTQQVTQRLLAETATIASEYTTSPRHLLLAPDPGVSLDAAATAEALDAMDAAPWLTTGRTGDLLDAADAGALTTDPRAGGEDLYALGPLTPADVTPSTPDEAGAWEHVEVTAPSTSPVSGGTVQELGATWGRLDVLAEAMEDDAALDAPRALLLSATSEVWREDPGVPATRADLASSREAELSSRVQVVPASGYNLISDAAGVPITVTNGLDTPITVRLSVSSDRPLVRIGQEPRIEVPARGEVSTTVPVEAIANGSVTLTTTLTTLEGRPLAAPVEVPLSVNPAWENWTTLLLVIGMGVLVVVGVLRARRTGSAARAPATRAPEDPVVLARTGRSLPADTAVDDTPDTPDTPDTREDRA